MRYLSFILFLFVGLAFANRPQIVQPTQPQETELWGHAGSVEVFIVQKTFNDLSQEDITFADVPWFSQATEVSTQLQALGFGYMGTDSEGDVHFQGALPFGHALITAFLDDEGQLVKITLTVASPFAVRNFFSLDEFFSEQYGNAHDRDNYHAVWVHNAATTHPSALAITVRSPSVLVLSFESASWGRDLKRRQQGLKGVI